MIHTTTQQSLHCVLCYYYLFSLCIMPPRYQYLFSLCIMLLCCYFFIVYFVLTCNDIVPSLPFLHAMILCHICGWYIFLLFPATLLFWYLVYVILDIIIYLYLYPSISLRVECDTQDELILVWCNNIKMDTSTLAAQQQRHHAAGHRVKKKMPERTTRDEKRPWTASRRHGTDARQPPATRAAPKPIPEGGYPPR